ncbi:MAG: DUF3887 domain-containing protein [Anaerolineales bacterium]|nr:DUF3887 domain-containing protein [Anaerolineales bacterium]
MKKSNLYLTVSGLVIILLLISGCSAEPAGLSDDQVGEVTTSILQAISADNYQAFTPDLSPQMLAAIPEDQFHAMSTMLQATSGDFVSLGELRMVNNQGYAVYVYTCVYEQEQVVVTITFAIGGTQVEGLFFDSPNLREANQ